MPWAARAVPPGQGGAGTQIISLYIGTYTDGASEGIYRIELDAVRESFSAPVLVAKAVNPTFFAWHPERPVMYAVSETSGVPPGNTGGLLAFRIGADGGLEQIGAVATGGASPCYVSLDAAAAHAFVANYHGPTVAVFRLQPDGRPGERTALIRHEGSGPHPVRQTRAYPHSIRLLPGGQFVAAADLGADRLFVYRFDPQTGALTRHDRAAEARPGAGPRHFAPHPDGRLIFVMNELGSTLASYAWDAAAGRFTPLDEVSTLPDGFTGENTTAEVAVHPSGLFVYGSNRGHDSIAAFRVGDRGGLSRIGLYPTGGRTPRHFAIVPGGRLLVVANQESDSLVLFRIDPATGELARTAAQVQVPAPAFVGIPGTSGNPS